MTVAYSASSPYATTEVYGQFLDIMQSRKITKYPDDVLYTIDSVYQYRPDILAFDLYNNSNLWWVFAVRNPNIIKDPIFDFAAGTIIYIPKKETLTADLGL